MESSKLDIKENWEKNIMLGKGKDIAKEFFLSFTTQENVSRKLYSHRLKNKKGDRKLKPNSKSKCCNAKLEGKKIKNEEGKFEKKYCCTNCNKIFEIQQKEHYVEPIINIRCREWDKYGFLERSKPITFKDKLGRPQKVYWKIMNLEPIYLFCKKNNIHFNEKEKEFLKVNLLSEYVRKEILEQYPNEDIINATIKYYVKNTIMKYLFYLRDVRENISKYKDHFKKVEELNNPKDELGKKLKRAHTKLMKELNSTYGSDSKNIIKDFDIIRVISHNLPTNPSIILFRDYLETIMEDYSFIQTLDNKMLSALQICPNPDKEITPKKIVKKVIRPRRESNPGRIRDRDES